MYEEEEEITPQENDEEDLRLLHNMDFIDQVSTFKCFWIRV